MFIDNKWKAQKNACTNQDSYTDFRDKRFVIQNSGIWDERRCSFVCFHESKRRVWWSLEQGGGDGVVFEGSVRKFRFFFGNGVLKMIWIRCNFSSLFFSLRNAFIRGIIFIATSIQNPLNLNCNINIARNSRQFLDCRISSV